jgi:hypothetical protein
LAAELAPLQGADLWDWVRWARSFLARPPVTGWDTFGVPDLDGRRARRRRERGRWDACLMNAGLMAWRPEVAGPLAAVMGQDLYAQGVHLALQGVYLAAERVRLAAQRVHLVAQRVYLAARRVHLALQRVHLALQRVHLASRRVYNAARRVYLDVPGSGRFEGEVTRVAR